MKYLLAVLCCVAPLLLSCSSTPVNEKYYLLDTDLATGADTGQSAGNSAVVVTLGDVKLADFLRQSELIIQTGEHRLDHARYHLWAESLVDAIPKALLRDMRVAAPGYRFEAEREQWLAEEDYRLYIRVDQFHPDNHSTVTAAGRYWIIDSKQRRQLIGKDFHFSEKLTEDGYANSVSQLRRLLRRLSVDIVNTLVNQSSP